MSDEQMMSENQPEAENQVWKRPGKSLIWKYFEKIDNGTKLRCKLCGKSYTPSKSKSTSTQLNHLRHQHKMKFSSHEPNDDSSEPHNSTPPAALSSFGSEEPVRLLPNEEKFSLMEDSFDGNDFNFWKTDDSSSSRDQSVDPFQREEKEDGRVQVLADLVRQQSLLLLQNGQEGKFQNFWKQVISAVAESNV